MNNQSLVSCTGRLERICVTLEKMGGGAGLPGKGKADLESLIGRLEKVMPNLRSGSEDRDAGSSGPSPSASSHSAAGTNGGLPFASAFDDVVLGPLAKYVSLSKAIGGDVATHAQMVERAFFLQKKFLDVASRCKEPSSPATLQSLLQGISGAIGEIQSFREKNRTSQFFNHLSAWSEGIPALGWITVAPTPGPHVKEMLDSAQFYTNRVLKDWKEKDKTHAEWVKAILEIFSTLQAYIKQHHTTGLVWNSRGQEPTPADVAACGGSGGGGASPAGAGPGGPPPPPPMIDLSADIARRMGSPPSTAPGGDRGALFDQLNRGGDVTKGLKKVTSEMQTHKNPNLRGSASTGTAKSSAQAPAGGSVSRIGADPNKTPTMELVNGKKWMVEHHNGNEGLVVNATAMNQVVYIFRCTNTVVQVKGKLSSIVMDSCKKTAVVFDNLVGPIEFVTCQGCKMQVIGTVPTVSIDNSDGIQMFLSKDAKHSVEIVTSKSSEMNVMVPQGDDFVEYPIPEQFKTTITPSGLSTVVADIAG